MWLIRVDQSELSICESEHSDRFSLPFTEGDYRVINYLLLNLVSFFLDLITGRPTVFSLLLQAREPVVTYVAGVVGWWFA